MLSLLKTARQCAWSVLPSFQLRIQGRAVSPCGASGSAALVGVSFPHTRSVAPLLAAPLTPVLTQTAGIKHMTTLKKRCRHCYFVIKDEQKYVMCTAKPRHYAAQKMQGKKYVKQFILIIIIISVNLQVGQLYSDARNSGRQKLREWSGIAAHEQPAKVEDGFLSLISL